MKPLLIFKAICFTLLMPGAVAVVVPYLLLGGSATMDWPELSTVRTIALVLGVGAGGVLLHCIWGFAFYGKGTPAPIDPPNSLVVQGLYAYTRNPMYNAVLAVLLSEALFFQSWALLIYAGSILLVFNLFIQLYEEPYLRDRFGARYLEYCRMVPRWGFTRRAFGRSADAT